MTNYQIKEAMMTITRRVDLMAKEVGPKISVHIGFTSVLSRAVDASSEGEWSVGFTWFNKKSKCFAATKTSRNLQEAIDGAMAKLSDTYAQIEVEPCEICGGRLDGKCYHVHDIDLEANEETAMTHMAAAIDAIGTTPLDETPERKDQG